MDTVFVISLILGLIQMSQGADDMLRCNECEHIGWNQTYGFNGVQNIYQLLQGKYNPRCAQDNPRDQNQWQQNQANQQQLENERRQQQQQQLPGSQFNSFYQNGGAIGETICPVYANTNRCSYLTGIATVFFPSYGGQMTLDMHVRNCVTATTDFEDGCYQRDTTLGYPEVRNFLQDRLQFLGTVDVRHFRGKQCYCRTNMCYIVSAGRNIEASGLSLLLTVLAFIVIK